MRYASYERGLCQSLRTALSGTPVLSSDDFPEILRYACAFLDDMDFVIVDRLSRAYVRAFDCYPDDTASSVPWRALPEWAAVRYG